MTVSDARQIAAPKRLLAVATITGAAAGCVALGAIVDGPHWRLLLRDALAVVALAGACLILWRRAGDRLVTNGESGVWRGLAGAMAVFSAGAVAQLVLDARPWSGAVLGQTAPAGSAVIFGLATLAAGPLVYWGLIGWNQVRGARIDARGEWLNGVSAVFVIVSIADLAMGWGTSAPIGLPWWAVQAPLFGIATAVVLLGTSTTMASVGGLQRDLRAWGITVSLAVIGCSELAFPLLGSGHEIANLPLLGWVVAAAVLAACAVLSSPPIELRRESSQGTATGALVVLLAAVAVLVLNGERLFRSGTGGPGGIDDRAPTLFATLAVLGVSTRLLHLVSDLTHLAQTRQQAHTDDLTGIANRRALMSRLDDAVEQGGPVSLLVLDLDRFKEVNDRYGHATGDDLLRSAAARFAALIPPDGLLARLGGDEFAILLNGGWAGACRLAGDLADEAASIVQIGGNTVHTTASIGVATSGADLDSEELLRRADTAMFRAKAGHLGVCRYDEQIDRTDRERATRIEELREALDPAGQQLNEQFVVHYQPQLELATGEVAGVEALVRWQHPVHGLLAPGDFLDLVEQFGLMPQLTERVLRQAAEQGARWHSGGRPLRVAVNLSASFLTHPALLALLDGVLASTGLDPAFLVLEVTETTLMIDADGGLRAAHAIASRGVGLSIDDYGTGYSSLAYLNDLPAVELKLDQSFIRRLLVDERTAAIVAATVGLAHRLGLRLIAEGVEDEATLSAVRLLGCDESQGYLHCRPQPVETLDPWLAQHTAAGRAVSRGAAGEQHEIAPSAR